MYPHENQPVEDWVNFFSKYSNLVNGIINDNNLLPGSTQFSRVEKYFFTFLTRCYKMDLLCKRE